MVRWTGHATVQLRLLHDYIARDSSLYAKRVMDALVRKSLLLNETPRIGRVVPEINNETIRELMLYSYRIIYEIKAADIDILAVIHKRRNLQTDEIPREE